MKHWPNLDRCKYLCTLQNISLLIFSLSLVTLLFSLFLYPTNSTDLGWHLKYGEYFTQYGKILTANTFSYTMPDFVWTNDSWVYDVVVYQIFNRFGFYGLAITGGLVGLGLTFLLNKLTKPKWEIFLIAFVPFYIILHTSFYHGLRAQTVSLIFLALTMWLVEKTSLFRKEGRQAISRAGRFKSYGLSKLPKSPRLAWLTARLAYPPCLAGRQVYKRGENLYSPIFLILYSIFLFAAWANWHGEYMVGLTYIGLVLVGKGIDELLHKKKLNSYKQLLPLVLVGLLASILTPFGIANHLQALTHIFSSRLDGIGEWSPWPTDSWQWWSVLIYGGFLGWNIIQNKKLWKFSLIIPFAIFTIQAILHRRMQGMWAVVTFPILIEIVNNYKIFPKSFKSYMLSFSFNPPSRNSPTCASPLVSARRVVRSWDAEGNFASQDFSSNEAYLKIPRPLGSGSFKFQIISIILSVLMLFGAWKISLTHNAWMSSWDQYCISQPYTLCSEGMLDYLKSNQVSDKMFNFYNWGGYLIWRYPQEKVFIDGRMVSWQDPTTGYLPYQQYDLMMQASDKGIEEFNNQNFTYALLPRNTKLGNALMTRLGWMKVYEDKRSVAIRKI